MIHKRNRNLRIRHQYVIWVLQERKKFLFIPYWRTVMISPFLEEVEEAYEFILRTLINRQPMTSSEFTSGTDNRQPITPKAKNKWN